MLVVKDLSFWWRPLGSHKIAVAYFTEVVYGFEARIAIHQGHHLAFGAAADFNRMMITVFGFDSDIKTIF